MKNYLEFYTTQIQDDFIPYWKKFYDYEDGGILNCINNYGDKRLSDNKFTWSQGRYLWVLARIYDIHQKHGTFPKIDMEDIKVQMKGTYDFIVNHSIYDDNICCYLLDKKGGKLVDERTGRYDASIFADCFALIGMAQYTKAMHLEEQVAPTRALFESIVKRVAENDFLTEPYPIPTGYKIHSIPMILSNTTYELVKMLEEFDLPADKEIAYGLEQVRTILEDFTRNGLVREHISTDENYENLLLDRHVNPGHTLEDMWFCCDMLKDYGDIDKYMPLIEEVSKNSFDIGWDTEFGGLLRFVDREGGKPSGVKGDSAFELLINDTWDMKLWWPHSEILFLFLYLYKLTGKQEFMDYYQKSEDYVFNVFPNKALGEWIQIRKRDGSPEEKVVALPVKDPFHILRNFIRIVELYV